MGTYLNPGNNGFREIWNEGKTACIPNEEERTEFRKILNGRNAKRKSMLPALVVELKWNKSSEGAIRQIKERNYPAVLKGYGGEIMIVGISYDAKEKEHSCVIKN